MACVTLAEEKKFVLFCFSITENITGKLYRQQGGSELLSPAVKGT